MGQCHAPEIKAPTPKRLTIRPSALSCPPSPGLSCESPSLTPIGTQPPPLATGDCVDAVVDREVLEVTTRGNGSIASSMNSLDSDSSSLPLMVGCEVTLVAGLEADEDGNLRPGKVGIISGVDKTADPPLYCVDTPEGYWGNVSRRSWWYTGSSLQPSTGLSTNLQGVKRLRSASQKSSDSDEAQRSLRRACHESIDVASLACARWNTRIRRLANS